jgi:hypothetical protein
MSQQLDAQGEAHEALCTAVASYGQRVLSDPHTLGNLVADLLPDLPRERSLLATGAEAGIAAEMRQHVEEQHIDPDTAVQLVARALSERRAIDPAAGIWVASEYAQVLGYKVRPYTPVVPPGQPRQVSPASSATSAMPAATEAPTIQVPSPQSWPPAGQEPQRPPGQFWQPPPQSWPPAGHAPQSWPPAGPPPQSWPPAGPSGQSWPAPQPSSGGPKNSWSGRKRGLIAAVTVAALIGGYLIAATVAHTFPFSKSRPVAAPSPVHSARPTPKPTHPAAPAPTGPALAAGVAPLIQLLPADIDDPATQCENNPPPYSFDTPGRVEALACTDPGLPKGSQVYAYQMDNHADFEATWQSYNKAIGITGANPGPNCPPANGGAGTTPMHGLFFPPRPGQLLECMMVRDGNGPPQPVYTWTFPTEDAFIVALGSSTFSALDSWWKKNKEPLNSPSPSTP